MSIGRLLDIVARLRAPGGCPWDREQTLASLRPFVLEETYEVLEAIDTSALEAVVDIHTFDPDELAGIEFLREHL